MLTRRQRVSESAAPLTAQFAGAPRSPHALPQASGAPYRVGFDARWFNDSGVGAYVSELLQAMVQAPRGFELVVYEDPSNRIPGLDQYSIRRVPVNSRRYSLAEQWEFRTRVCEDRLDLFHSPFYAAPVALGCPLVVTVHDLIPFLFQIDSRPKQALVKAGYRVAVRRSCHLIADSQRTASDLKALLHVPSGKITTVPLAPRECFGSQAEHGELERLRAKYEIHPPYVMVVSARNWRTKNLKSAVRALEIARQTSGVSFQTLVVGPREGFEALPSPAWTALQPRVTGYVEATDLAALFRHAHAFIMPSLYEGFGLPVVEAMACGCPVICSNAGSLAEVAGDGAQVFAPFDVAGMGAATVRLLRSVEELAHWKEAARLRAAEFSWSRTAAQTIAVYQQLLSSPVTGVAAGA